MSAAVIAADGASAACASRGDPGIYLGIDLAGLFHVRRGKHADLAGAFPARHVILVELHEFDGRSHRLFLVA
jgi:hypothetical protein